MFADITESMVAQGFPITASGYYSLQKNLYVGVPAVPSKKNWHVFSRDDRPCVLKVLADDVTVDLNGFVLAASTEHTQGLALVYVATGVKNFTLKQGHLMTCCVGVFLDIRCSNSTLVNLQVSNFLEKGILSYSPQGLFVSDCIVGPNLSIFYTMSQELYALVRYGSAITPSELAAWQNFSDNLALAETSHVAGISIVPDAKHDAPYPAEKDTGSGVVLRNVQVTQLTMNFREHSLLLGVGVITNTVSKARGILGEVLPEWYLLRKTASKRLQVGFYPSLQEKDTSFATDAGGFLVNTGYTSDGYEEQVTVWVRGVDREGNGVRGVQAILVVGAGSPLLENVQTEMPIFATLSSRVLLPAPKHVEKIDLTSAKRAFQVVVLPSPTQTDKYCCPNVEGAASAYFSRERASFDVRPGGNQRPILTGSIFGIGSK